MGEDRKTGEFLDHAIRPEQPKPYMKGERAVTIDNSAVRILIVDDMPENLKLSSIILEREKYDVYTAESGQAALEMLDSVRFDLVLLDITMPLMDGFETSRRIKGKFEREEIPIIFLTARTDVESMARAFELGAVDYVIKPFNGIELAAKVRNHVEFKRIREELEIKTRKLEEAYAELETQATTDPLTGLFNRREMLNRIECERARFERDGVRFSIIMADIDFFKKVNDNYGHECGDFILKSVSDILRTNVRKQDAVARWDGEEFLLMLPSTSPTGAAAAAEKLRKKVADELFTYNSNDIRITMTFGISDASLSGSVDELIKSAEEARYSGKQKGNCVVASGIK